MRQATFVKKRLYLFLTLSRQPSEKERVDEKRKAEV